MKHMLDVYTMFSRDLIPRRVIYNEPATIVLWSDGSKTVVKCHDGDKYDPLIGYLLCTMKRMYGNTSIYNEYIRMSLPEEYEYAKKVPKVTGEILMVPYEEAISKVEPLPGFTSKPYSAVNLEDVLKDDQVDEETDKIRIDIPDEQFKASASIGEEESIKDTIARVRANSSGYRSHNKVSFLRLEEFCKENDLNYGDMDTLLNWTPGEFSNSVMTKRRDAVRKNRIDDVLKVTGLTYAEAFG